MASNYYYSALEKALGGSKRLSATGFIDDWSPNNIRSLILGTGYIILETHIGKNKFRPLVLDQNLVYEEISSGDFIDPLLIFSKRKAFSCLEEVIIDTNLPFSWDFLLDDRVNTRSRLRAVSRAEISQIEGSAIYGFLSQYRSENKNSLLGTALSTNIPVESKVIDEEGKYYTKHLLRERYYGLDKEGGLLDKHFKKLEDELSTAAQKQNQQNQIKNLVRDYVSMDLEYVDALDNLVGLVEESMSEIRGGNCSAQQVSLYQALVSLLRDLLANDQDFNLYGLISDQGYSGDIHRLVERVYIPLGYVSAEKPQGVRVRLNNRGNEPLGIIPLLRKYNSGVAKEYCLALRGANLETDKLNKVQDDPNNLYAILADSLSQIKSLALLNTNSEEDSESSEEDDWDMNLDNEENSEDSNLDLESSEDDDWDMDLGISDSSPDISSDEGSSDYSDDSVGTTDTDNFQEELDVSEGSSGIDIDDSEDDSEDKEEDSESSVLFSNKLTPELQKKILAKHRVTIQGAVQGIIDEYTRIFSSGYGVKRPYGIVSCDESGEGIILQLSGNQVLSNDYNSVIQSAYSIVNQYMNLVPCNSRSFTEIANVIVNGKTSDDDSKTYTGNVYFPKKMLEFAFGRCCPKGNTNADTDFPPHAKSRTWSTYCKEHMRPSLTRVFEGVAIKQLESAGLLDDYGKREAVEAIKGIFVKVRQALCTCVMVSRYDEVGGNPAALKLRILDPTGSLPREQNLARDIIMDVAMSDGGKNASSPAPVTEGQYFVEYLHEYNHSLCNAEPLFAFKALESLAQRPSWETLLLGLDANDEVLQCGGDGGIDLKANLTHQIIAGSRSGKGVMTLNILASAIMSGKPVFYLDNKPDMASLMLEMCDEAFVVNGCQCAQDIANGTDYFDKFGKARIAQLDSMVKRPPYINKVLSSGKYSAVAALVYGRALLLVMSIILARTVCPDHLDKLGGPNGIVLVVDELGNAEGDFKTNVLRDGMSVRENYISASYIRTVQAYQEELEQWRESGKGKKPMPKIDAAPQHLYFSALYEAFKKSEQELMKNSVAGLKNNEAKYSDIFMLSQAIPESIFSLNEIDKVYADRNSTGVGKGFKPEADILSSLLMVGGVDGFIGYNAKERGYLGQGKKESVSYSRLDANARNFAYVPDLSSVGIEKVTKGGPEYAASPEVRYFKPFLIFADGDQNKYFVRNCLDYAKSSGIDPKDIIARNCAPGDESKINPAVGFREYINMAGASNEEIYSSLKQGGDIANYVVHALGYPGDWQEFLLDLRPQWIFSVESVVDALEGKGNLRHRNLNDPADICHEFYQVFPEEFGGADGDIELIGDELDELDFEENSGFTSGELDEAGDVFDEGEGTIDDVPGGAFEDFDDVLDEDNTNLSDSSSISTEGWREQQLQRDIDIDSIDFISPEQVTNPYSRESNNDSSTRRKIVNVDPTPEDMSEWEKNMRVFAAGGNGNSSVPPQIKGIDTSRYGTIVNQQTQRRLLGVEKTDREKFIDSLSPDEMRRLLLSAVNEDSSRPIKEAYDRGKQSGNFGDFDRQVRGLNFSSQPHTVHGRAGSTYVYNEDGYGKDVFALPDGRVVKVIQQAPDISSVISPEMTEENLSPNEMKKLVRNITRIIVDTVGGPQRIYNLAVHGEALIINNLMFECPLSSAYLRNLPSYVRDALENGQLAYFFAYDQLRTFPNLHTLSFDSKQFVSEVVSVMMGYGERCSVDLFFEDLHPLQNFMIGTYIFSRSDYKEQLQQNSIFYEPTRARQMYNDACRLFSSGMRTGGRNAYHVMQNKNIHGFKKFWGVTSGLTQATASGLGYAGMKFGHFMSRGFKEIGKMMSK